MAAALSFTINSSARASGIRAARGKCVIMGDSDGSYDFGNLQPLVDKLRQGYQLVMGPTESCKGFPTPHTPLDVGGVRKTCLALNLLLFAAACASLWLRTAFPVYAIADAEARFDDQLFIRMARNIITGHWLGDYSQFTHAKGIFYPLFVDVSFFLGISLKILEHIFYLGSSFLFCHVVERVTGRRSAAGLIFLLLAFNPLLFYPELARVIRDGLYISLSLALVAFAAGAFLTERLRSDRHLLQGRVLWLVGCGLTGGAFWLTREEGVWILPALAPLIGLWLWRRAREWRQAIEPRRARWHRLAGDAAVLAIPMGCFLLVVNAVNLLNFAYYGVFRNNDFRSTDLQAAYGAISRIEPDHWRRYVVFPSDARERAYAVSPAAAELKPFFEGPTAANWRDSGCRQSGIADCPEILAGWFLWALRDAVADAGYYHDARAARSFYKRLATEINAACDKGRITCRAPRATMMPPFRSEYVFPILTAARSLALHLVAMGGGVIGAPPSRGHSENLTMFRDMLGGAMTSPAPMSIANEAAGGLSISAVKLRIQMTIARLIAETYAWTVPFLFGFSVLALLAGMIRRGRLYGNAGTAALAIACFAAAAARIALLAFIDATSFQADNDIYLSSATPFLLALIGLCVIEGGMKAEPT